MVTQKIHLLQALISRMRGSYLRYSGSMMIPREHS